MSNQTTEYIVKLKDLVSGGLSRLQRTGDNAFNALQRGANSANATLNRMPASIADLNRRLDDLRRTREISVDRRQVQQLGNEIERVERQLGRLQGRGGGGLGALMGGGAGLAMMAGAGLGAGALVGGVMRDEQNLVSMEVLSGSAMAGGQLFNTIKAYAMATPYMMKDLLAASEMMLGFGVSVDNVMPSLRMLSDVARGDQQRLQSLSLAYSQVMAAGKLQGQDLLQFVNAGFNPLKEMSRTTGRSLAELREEMQKGNISAADVARAFQSATSEGGLFFNMTDRMSQTLGGRLSTLKDNAFEAGKSIMSMAVGPLNGLMEMANFLLKYKEVVMTVGLTWLAYSKYQAVATFATQLFTGGLFTMRAALIATGIGAIAVVVGLLINLGVRMKEAGVKMEDLKGIVMAFGGSVKNTFQLMYENVTFTFEKMWLKAKIAWERIKGLVTGTDASASMSALSQLEKAHDARVKALKNERDLNILAGKAGLKGIKDALNKEGSGTAIGGLDMSQITGGAGTGLADAAAAGANSVSSGGARSIVINIGKFQDAVNITTTTMGDAITDIERRLTEMMLRVANSAALVQ